MEIEVNNLIHAAKQALEAYDADDSMAAVMERLRAALDLPEQEAVIGVSSLSKMFESLDGLDRNADGYHWRMGWNDALRRAMDYCQTAPTPRKPLTDKEIEPLCDALPCYDIGNNDLIGFARAIERKHGIGEQHE